MVKRGDGYHHGELRLALIDAAAEMIAEKGVEGVTMRGLAQRVGVSRTAAYRHFADKTTLLAAVAEEGFGRLVVCLREAQEAAAGDSLQGFRQMCVAYVRFAADNPTHYRLMFGLKVSDPQGHPGLFRAAGQAFGEVIQVVGRCQQEGSLRSGPSRELGLTAWALAHGLSLLVIDQRIPPGGDASALVGFAADALLEGIGQQVA